MFCSIICEVFAVNILPPMKYKVNELFFDNWNDTMAYVLGFIYADGSLENSLCNRGRYIRVSNTELILVERIKKWLSSDHRIAVWQPTLIHRKSKFLLRVGSKKLYNALIKKGLIPRKSLIIQFPNVPIRYQRHFIRGYFDGDGCAYLERRDGKSGLIVKRLSVIFTSGSRVFVERLKEVLDVYAIQRGILVSGHSAFQLRYSTKASIQIFKYFYQNVDDELFLRRKFDVFKKYFSLLPMRADGKIHKILSAH